MPKRLRRLQNIWFEKVVSRLRDHFVTESGKVIEGNYDVGEMAPIIFDRKPMRFLPVYKEKTGYEVTPMMLKESEVRQRRAKFCTIEFIDMPTTVQPMRYPGEIREGEVEGIDFIKTYYQCDLSKCSTCNPEGEIEFTFDFVIEQQVDYYDAEPNNHCVISQDGGCHGEVIDRGSDQGGNYIRWKVYTESSDYNRSGLGYFLVRAKIKTSTGVVACLAQYLVGVDCCEKSGLTQPEIYWEDWQWADCTEFIYYGQTKLCKVATNISLSHLLWYAAGEGGNAGRFYSIPEGGGCPTYDWTSIGIGSIEVADPWGRMIIWRPPETIDCHSFAYVKVIDGCGGEDYFITESCCDAAAPVVMSYTSLIMPCGGSQTLGVSGGCGPYQWSLSGGGTLTPNEATTGAIYDAPESNEGCAFNPTITVTDCCGVEDSIQLAVNCYTGDEVAYRVYKAKWSNPPPSTGCKYSPDCGYFCSVQSWYDRYRCDGLYLGESYEGLWRYWVHPCGAISNPCASSSECYAIQFADRISNPGCPNAGLMNPCGYVEDVRSEDMKNEGCCPINPYTGLPF